MISSSPLDDIRHALASFGSGEPSLDEWLVSSAVASDASGTTRTFVGTDPDNSMVIGYYALTAHVLQRAALPGTSGPGSPTDIAAVLLAHLALDKHRQG